MPKTGIVYSGGTYGTYLNWALLTLAKDIPIVPPFRHNGNSHNFVSSVPSQYARHADNATRLVRQQPTELPDLFRCHPKISATESIVENISQLVKYADRLIILYPDKESYLLAINNFYYKIWTNIFQTIGKDGVAHMYASFDIPSTTPLSQIPNSIVREFLSYYTFDSWEDQVEWFLPDQFSHPQCKFVFVKDLLYNFESTLLEIQEFTKIKFIKPIDCLENLHKTNVSQQTYTGQYQLACNILDNVNLNRDFSWASSELTLVTESWIQRQLRSQGVELQCTDLDTFPTSVAELKSKFV
jgi:hypothetical protein